MLFPRHTLYTCTVNSIYFAGCIFCVFDIHVFRIPQELVFNFANFVWVTFVVLLLTITSVWRPATKIKELRSFHEFYY